MIYHHQRRDCQADFQNCHECLPGRYIPIAEHLMRHMQHEQQFIILSPKDEERFYFSILNRTERLDGIIILNHMLRRFVM
jgi:hypothetical protein